MIILLESANEKEKRDKWKTNTKVTYVHSNLKFEKIGLTIKTGAVNT